MVYLRLCYDRLDQRNFEAREVSVIIYLFPLYAVLLCTIQQVMTGIPFKYEYITGLYTAFNICKIASIQTDRIPYHVG